MKRRTPPWTQRGSIVRIMAAVLFAGLFTTACQESTGPEQLDSLTLTAAAATVQPTGTVQLTAVGTRAGRDVTNLLGQTYAVTSGSGSVSATGVFTAPSTAGTSTITVTCGGRTASVNVTVVAGPLASITVTPNPATLQIQMTQQFTAVGHDAFNNVVVITPVWSSTPAAGTINASTGLFTAGTTTGTFPAAVTATSGAISGSAAVTVLAGPLATITVTPNPVTLAIGVQQQFTAIGHDAGGNQIPISPVWSSTNPPGTINAATGMFTAGNTLGTFAGSVRATQGSISGTATVTVIAGPLATLTVTPDPVTLAIGTQQQFTAVGRDAGGNQVPVTAVWSSTNPPGTINASTGLFTAGNTLGTFPASVTATSGSISASATVTVIAGPLATITVTPDPVVLAIGMQQQFTAVGRDAGGNEVPLTAVWSTTNPPGTINASTGLFTAGNTIGTFPGSVTATSGSISGSASVTVLAGPLASITVTPNPASLGIGEQQQFTAIGRDAGGNEVPLIAVWSTTSPPGSINSATGLFTAGNTVGTFTNSVTATLGAISGSATVTVTPGPLATITVTPNPVTLAIGTQQQFTAVGRDAGGNEVPVTAVWSSTNPPGTINAATGLFTAGNTLGTFANSVTATVGAISGSATVTVIAGPLATITVTPNPTTVETTQQRQFTAVGRDAGGNVVPISPVWSTTNPPGTINDATGLFTAGNTTGLFSNSVRATQGGIFGTATVTITAPVVIPPPLPAAGNRMIARVAWTCTDGSITGDVATNQTVGEVPPGSVTQTNCPITGTIDIGSPIAKQAYLDFLDAYATREATACGTTLTGTLAGVILAPGVYCFDNAATLTGTLTLSGGATDQWLFKVGAAGIPGALSTTNFDVVMAGGASACNVTWWTRQAATMVTSNFQGHILAGAGISFTGGTYKGNSWSQEDVAVTGTVVNACDAP